jgi:hypothetical protein
MTSFCAQCGNQVRSGGKFCQSCGTAVVQSAAPPQSPSQGSYQSSYPAGYQGNFAPQVQPEYAPPARSGNTLKIVLITLAVLLFLAGGSVIAFTFYLRSRLANIVSVKEGQGGQSEVAINAPGGQIKVTAGSSITEEQLGVPIYPGATVGSDGGSITFAGEGAKGHGWFGASVFRTEDNMDDVVAFYKEKLGDQARTLDSTTDGTRTVVFTLETDKGWRMVTVSNEEAKVTKIAVASAGGKAAQ